MVQIMISDVLSAFDSGCVGTRVRDIGLFMDAVRKTVEEHTFTEGQAVLQLPASVNACVSTGVGRRTASYEDYTVRAHRGQVGAYLKRRCAAQTEHVSVVVYTIDAYLADPDVMKDKAETARAKSSNATHVLVAILAYAGPKAPVSPYRFVANLAGGNNAYKDKTLEELRAEAQDVIAYDNEWCVVSD